ncbi:MAG TPA: FAD-dependent monooxygenase [Streptosporangiaceae bacterium]|nr:FAD-dependent monooxygenase [Streptosporangiaceae bacterium]
MPRVIVMGGSLGGLTAALVLRDAGCEVRVFERSSSALQARGAGIAALDATLRYLVERGGHRPEDVCSSTGWIRFFNRDGSLRHEQRHRYRFSSWNTIYRSLLSLLETERYLLGHEVMAFGQDADTVSVTLADGAQAETDLLVCADGVGSAARARLIPGAAPSYAGYVAWRGTLPERSLSPSARKAFDDAINYQVLADSHILVYPIPGLDGSLAQGDRLINMVWYINVAAGEDLDRLMTGRDGIRRAVSLPPGAATDEAVAGMRRAAEQVFAAPIAEVVTGVAKPFVQAVYDIDVPRMALGRACLIGDAAFAVRPHAAAATAKAADDGWALAEELAAAGGVVPAALAVWERRQLLVGRQLLARTREIGDSSQFTGTFRPGDPRLIFGLHEPGH